MAQTFGTTPSALMAANNLTTSTVTVGQTLLVPASGDYQVGESLAQKALQYLGVPYRWGGTTPAGFDCSGFVQYVAGLMGITLPRTSSAQFKTGASVPTVDLLPGDLVFFDTYSYASHVGIYIGNGLFVTAPNSGQTVDIQSLSSVYWGPRYIGARRVTHLP